MVSDDKLMIKINVDNYQKENKVNFINKKDLSQIIMKLINNFKY